MITASFLPVSIWLLATNLIINLVVGIVFPLLVIGLGIKFMRNIDKL